MPEGWEPEECAVLKEHLLSPKFEAAVYQQVRDRLSRRTMEACRKQWLSLRRDYLTKLGKQSLSLEAVVALHFSHAASEVLTNDEKGRISFSFFCQITKSWLGKDALRKRFQRERGAVEAFYEQNGKYDRCVCCGRMLVRGVLCEGCETKVATVGRSKLGGGLGLFAKREVQKGNFIAQYYSKEDLFAKDALTPLPTRNGEFAFEYVLTDIFDVDGVGGTYRPKLRSLGRFAQNSCPGSSTLNAKLKDGKLFAIKRIGRGSEICWDYKAKVTKGDPRTECKCDMTRAVHYIEEYV